LYTRNNLKHTKETKSGENGLANEATASVTLSSRILPIQLADLTSKHVLHINSQNRRYLLFISQTKHHLLLDSSSVQCK